MTAFCMVSNNAMLDQQGDVRVSQQVKGFVTGKMEPCGREMSISGELVTVRFVNRGDMIV